MPRLRQGCCRSTRLGLVAAISVRSPINTSAVLSFHWIEPRRPMKLSELTWPAIAALPKDTPVVFPVAALEQHGGHMPLFTDSLLCGEVVRRVEERLGDRVLFAPLLWLGNSDHHLDFA